jgi:ketosteroid isomerase-like protein
VAAILSREERDVADHPTPARRRSCFKENEMTAKTLDDAIALNHAALDAMVKGDSTGYVALLSDRDDVTWGNPFGPFARGRERVEATLASAAARMQGGRASNFERIATYLAEGLAVVVEVEHAETKTDGAGAVSPAALRVTSVFRLEGDAWKLVHRHADPITTPR